MNRKNENHVNRRSISFNAVLNIFKQVCMVIFPLISYPYASRILGVTNYGKVDAANSIIGYFSLFAALGVSAYAIRSGSKIRDDHERFNEFASEVFTINLIATLIAYAVLIIMLCTPLFDHDYRLLLMIQSITILCTTIGMDWVNTIYEDYLYITIRYIVVQCAAMAALFLFVHKRSDYFVFAFINMAANAGANLFNIFYLKRYVHVSLKINRNSLKHLKSIIYFFGNTIASTIYINSDTTLILIFKNSTDVGIYGAATRVYTMAKTFLNAVLDVSYPRASYYVGKDDNDNYRFLITKLLNILIVLIFSFSTGIICMSREIVLLFAGKEFENAYVPLSVLSLALIFAVFAAFYTTCILLPNGGEKKFMSVTIVSAAVNIILNCGFVPFLTYTGAAITTLISEFIVFAACRHYAMKIIAVKGKKRDKTAAAIGCLCIAAVCLIVKYFFSDIMERILIGVPVSVIIYASVMILFRTDIAEMVIDMLKRARK